MSRLGDLEAAIVDRLADDTIGGSATFAIVRGASGGNRPALRTSLSRELTPAAYVAFVEEPTAPEVDFVRYGPIFHVFVAARMLRAGSDPRNGDTDEHGAFTLIDRVKQRLDGWQPTADVWFYNLSIKFVDADDRLAIYELLYRVWPVPLAILAPDAPADLTSSVDGDEVTLDWSAPAESSEFGPVEYYEILRKLPTDDDYVVIAATDKGSLSIVLIDQPTGVLLQYQVRAGNTGGKGETSNNVSLSL